MLGGGSCYLGTFSILSILSYTNQLYISENPYTFIIKGWWLKLVNRISTIKDRG